MPARKFTLGHSIRVIMAIGWSDFRMKYRGSFLGYLWSLAVPLVKFCVILYVFGPFVQDTIPQYPLYLFLGILIWEHFAVTTNACMTMLHEKSQIIQRMPFSRVLLIFAVGWTNLIVFMTYLIIFALYSWAVQHSWAWSSFYLIITVIEMTLLALGAGMLLASWSLKFRDIPHLWSVLTQILFWLTPVMYYFQVDGASGTFSAAQKFFSSSIGEMVKIFVNIQPLSVIMQDARRAVLYSTEWGAPTFIHTLGILLVCSTVFLIGLVTFQRRQNSFLDEY